MVKKAINVLESLTDEQLLALQFTMPWQYDAEASGYKDPDGFKSESKSKANQSREALQIECWNKFNTNPHLNTAVRGIVGRLAGAEFEISSEVREIQDTLEDEWFDPRNRLYNFIPKYVGRGLIEGELFLCLTVNPDSFVIIAFDNLLAKFSQPIADGKTAGIIHNFFNFIIFHQIFHFGNRFSNRHRSEFLPGKQSGPTAKRTLSPPAIPPKHRISAGGAVKIRVFMRI